MPPLPSTELTLELTLEAASRAEIGELAAALAAAWPGLARACGLHPALAWERGFEPEGDERGDIHGVLELRLGLDHTPSPAVLDDALTLLATRLWQVLTSEDSPSAVHLEDLELSLAAHEETGES